MKKPSLAICLDDLRLEFKEALNRARTLGFRAVEVNATCGPISPDELSRTGQRHFLKHLSDLGLRAATLRGPASGRGYGDAASGERRLDTMRRIINLAASLRVPVVSTTPGSPPDPDDEAQSSRLREALDRLADDADRTGVTVTIETAGMSASVLNQLLVEIHCPVLAACCDSGAMLMQGDDPHRVGETLPGRVRLVRSRDAVRGSVDAAGYEVALGEGHLDPTRFLAALTEAGFTGDIVLSRTTGSRPAADLYKARLEWEKLLTSD